MLDRAPPARRPGLDRGGHRDQPPPRDQPAAVVLEIDTDFADLFEVKDGVDAERDVTCEHDAGPSRSPTSGATSSARSRSRPASRPRSPAGLRLQAGARPGRAVVDHASRSPRARRSRDHFPRREPRGDAGGSEREEDGRARSVAGARTRAASARTRRCSHLPREPQRSRARCGCIPISTEGATLPAAGLPWFMALFGRDSLITSLQALPYLPELAATTLRVLAARQATCAMTSRTGSRARSSTSCASVSSPRAGSARTPPISAPPTRRRCSSSCSTSTTAGPATTRWSARSSPTRGRRWSGSTTAATATATATSSTSGATRHAGWSTNAGRTAGTRSSSPTARSPTGRSPRARSRATSTTRSGAAPGWRARSGTTRRSRERLERRADDAARRFQTRLLDPRARLHALALDGDKRQVDSLTSNIGHLLWSGILDDAEAGRHRRAAARRAAVLRLGRPHAGRARGRLQPARLPHRDRLASRQLADRRRPGPLRPPGGRRQDRRGDARRGPVLRVPPPRGLRRLPALADLGARGVPDRLAPAGLGRGRAAAAADARCWACARVSPKRTASCPGASARSACTGAERATTTPSCRRSLRTPRRRRPTEAGDPVTAGPLELVARAADAPPGLGRPHARASTRRR